MAEALRQHKKYEQRSNKGHIFLEKCGITISNSKKGNAKEMQMPIQTRTCLPGLPYHLVQRSYRLEPSFLEEEDYQTYLEIWKTVAERYGIAVHAYCLMPNHVHFLLTPKTSTAIANAMKAIRNRYGLYIKIKYSGKGTLLESYYRSSLVQSQTYLHMCMRYIELNAVRKGVVDQPEDYPWSSYRINARGESSWIIPHVEYTRLSTTTVGRQNKYRELFNQDLSEMDLNLIRNAVLFSQPLGNERFRQFIDEKYSYESQQSRRENAGY